MNRHEPQQPLSPLILVVEDDMMLAMLLEDQLSELGYRSIKAARIEAAVAIAEGTQIDAAILDVNVAGEPSYPVAEQLRQRGIPFVFATGYSVARLNGNFSGVPTLGKPYSYAELQHVLAAALETPA